MNSVPDKSKIAVVGSGAIGLYYGGLLAKAGHEVHFLLRSDFEAVQEHGIRIRTCGEEITVHPVRAHDSTASIGPCDLVLIALKTTSNDALPALVPPLLASGTALLTLQNGLGNEDLLATLFPGSRIFGGLCFICLNRVAPGVVEHFGHGTISLGERGATPSDELRRTADHFSNAGVETHLAEDLELERWRKLVWNVPFNGLAIPADNATVDVVLADPELRAEAIALMQEIIRGSATLGMHIPADFVDFQIQRSEKMGAYKASSLVDFLAGRPVEVDPIWAEPLRRARAAGVELPRLALLLALLRRRCSEQLNAPQAP